MNDTEQDNDVTLTVRLPVGLALFVKDQADKQFNSRSGIMRLAVSKLRESYQPPAAQSEEPDSEDSEGGEDETLEEMALTN